MRKRYQYILKQFFHSQLLHTRSDMGLTQSQMADLLEMDERSYIELEHGKSACSAVTLVLFLTHCCPDPAEFLRSLGRELSAEDERIA